MRDVTLVLLTKDDEILLAMKKRGFGVGKWNGVGGKLLDGESLEDAALREMEEEIGVKAKPEHLNKKGSIKFYFNNKPDWDQEVHIFFVNDWEGEPQESEEMKPKWYKHYEIPFNEMWKDDIHWLPVCLKGKNVSGEFYFNEDGSIIEKFEIREV